MGICIICLLKIVSGIVFFKKSSGVDELVHLFFCPYVILMLNPVLDIGQASSDQLCILLKQFCVGCKKWDVTVTDN